MRQRKIKDIEEKLIAYEDLIVRDPIAWRGRWREVFDAEAGVLDARTSQLADHVAPAVPAEDAPLFVEIGCGKGQFIATSASENPAARFIAIEGFSSVIYRALQKVRSAEIENVRFILDFVFDLGTWFGNGEVDGLFLNFSDPWPKKKNAKRRLTYRDRFEQYAKALSSGGFLKIKTDNDAFFDFTLEEFDAVMSKCGFSIEAVTRDLHNSEWREQSPMTEYESKFVEKGKNINYLALKKE